MDKLIELLIINPQLLNEKPNSNALAFNVIRLKVKINNIDSVG